MHRFSFAFVIEKSPKIKKLYKRKEEKKENHRSPPAGSEHAGKICKKKVFFGSFTVNECANLTKATRLVELYGWICYRLRWSDS